MLKNFLRLSSHFKSDIDSTVLLDFIYSIGVAFYGEVVKGRDYVIVTKDSTFQCDNNDKYIYFGSRRLSRCYSSI